MDFNYYYNGILYPAIRDLNDDQWDFVNYMVTDNPDVIFFLTISTTDIENLF